MNMEQLHANGTTTKPPQRARAPHRYRGPAIDHNQINLPKNPEILSYTAGKVKTVMNAGAPRHNNGGPKNLGKK